MNSQVGRLRAVTILGLTAAVCACLPPAAGAGIGPAPVVCNAYAPVPNCYYAAVSGTDTFHISSHFIHPGQIVTGTYKWSIGGQGNGEFAAVGSVAVDDFGSGLKLIRCHGPLTASNAKAAWHTKHAFDITEGHTTCEWKARYGTGWSTDLGLSVYAGGQTYKAGDYYTVDSKKTALEGTIRFRNDRGSPPTSLGVPGSRVHIQGPHGTQYNASTNTDGYWYVLLNHGGSFKVDPIVPRKYRVGKDAVSPKDVHVHVASGGIGKAEFKVKDPLQVTLKLDKSSVVAAGAAIGGAGAVSEEIVTGTVKVTESGAPDPGFQVAIRPYEGKNLSLAHFPVLARICGAAGAWPTFGAGDANNVLHAYTDASGEIKFSIVVGTTPGNLTIEARPTDQSSTALQEVDLSRVDPVETLRITPLGGQGTISSGLKADIGLHGYLMGATSTWAAQMSRIAAQGELGNYNVAPIYRRSGPGTGAVLVYPAGTRIQISNSDGSLLSDPPGSYVIEPDLWAGKGIVPVGFETAARFGGIAAFPTLQQWLTGGVLPAGASGDWNLGPVQSTPGTAYDADNQGYSFGFGYDGAGC